MLIEKSYVESITEISKRIFLLKVHSPSIAQSAKPGQFCNIKVSDTDFPLLRRPFSVCDVEGDSLYFMFDIHGEGTKMLSCKKEKDEIDILGPLGQGFIIEGDYKTAVIVAGGIGAAPFPYLTRAISNKKNIVCFIGGRSQQQLISYGMNNIYEATDDGSKGFHGNVIEFLKIKLPEVVKDKIRIFACGPNPMLKALQEYALASNLDCQISVECSMACGFGICQGCPIDKLNDEGYFLVCKDGPVFNADMVKL